MTCGAHTNKIDLFLLGLLSVDPWRRSGRTSDLFPTMQTQVWTRLCSFSFGVHSVKKD